MVTKMDIKTGNPPVNKRKSITQAKEMNKRLIQTKKETSANRK